MKLNPKDFWGLPEKEGPFKVGDKVRTYKGIGRIQYIASDGSELVPIKYTTSTVKRVMVVHDHLIDGGHDGNGGCLSYGFQRLPEFEGKCFWYHYSEIKKV